MFMFQLYKKNTNKFSGHPPKYVVYQIIGTQHLKYVAGSPLESFLVPLECDNLSLSLLLARSAKSCSRMSKTVRS